MDASSMWDYPGTWVGLGITLVMIVGFVLFAYALRRTMGSPPIDEQQPTTRIDSESDKKQ